MGESLIDQLIKLVVHTIEGSAQRERQDGVVVGEHGDGGPEYTGFKAREQARDFPAIRRDEVPIRARRPEDQSF